MSDGPNKDTFSIAYHEAGHAVVAHYFGRVLEEIWIDPETSHGETKVRPPNKATNTKTDVEQEARILLAGGRAQRMFGSSLGSSTGVEAFEDEGKHYTLLVKFLDPNGEYQDIDERDAEIERWDDRLARISQTP